MKIYNPRTHIGALKFPLALLIGLLTKKREQRGRLEVLFYTNITSRKRLFLSWSGICPAPCVQPILLSCSPALFLDMYLRYLAIFEDKSQYFQRS